MNSSPLFCKFLILKAEAELFVTLSMSNLSEVRFAQNNFLGLLSIRIVWAFFFFLSHLIYTLSHFASTST